ncbi:MAG TPA: FAD:protein FMN transferase [Candidatus Eisenbacteria bacterium]|nr:FAD:protein FMN transferase [Candidatus Eisenbacteria bacterium]
MRPTLRRLTYSALVVLAVPVLGAAPGSVRTVSWTIRTMGTYGRIGIVAADSSALADEAEAGLSAFRRIDSLMTNWTTTSEVARINREAAAGPVTVHPEVATVLEASLAIWRESAGAFDITVEPLVRAWGFIGGPRRVPSAPEIATALARVGADQVQFDRSQRTLRFGREGMRIDLGGIAKGYAVDVVAESLRAHGVTDALVDLSGNMVALGAPPGAPGWRIGVRDPRDRVPWLGRITLSGEAISTSGQYEQFVAADGRTYGHILDPHTGRPCEGLISVTVVGPTAMTCDGWDTPLFVLGPVEARRKARALDRIAAILVQPGTSGVDTLWVETSLRERFVLEPNARPFIHLRYF